MPEQRPKLNMFRALGDYFARSADALEYELAMPQLPSNPFFNSRSDRVALARQRYFEEGQPPSGVMG